MERTSTRRMSEVERLAKSLSAGSPLAVHESARTSSTFSGPSAAVTAATQARQPARGEADADAPAGELHVQRAQRGDDSPRRGLRPRPQIESSRRAAGLSATPAAPPVSGLRSSRCGVGFH